VDQGLAAAQVLAVAGGVLGDQADLGDALAGQPGDLVEDLGRPPGPEPAPERGDGAERAVPVAPLGQLDQSHRPPRRRPGRERRPVRGREHHRQGPPPHRDQGGSPPPTRRAAQQLREPAVVGERDDGVRLRELDPQLLGVPLGQAAGDQDRPRPPLLLEGGRVQDRLDRLALGRLHERTGVDDHGVGLLGVVHHLVAAGRQQPGRVLGVDLVAPASQGDDRHRGRWRGGGIGHAGSPRARQDAGQHATSRGAVRRRVRPRGVPGWTRGARPGSGG
jgi:hypothetical protein